MVAFPNDTSMFVQTKWVFNEFVCMFIIRDFAFFSFFFLFFFVWTNVKSASSLSSHLAMQRLSSESDNMPRHDDALGSLEGGYTVFSM